jgi:NADH-quinone oxidoreductase subunit M
VQSDVKKLVAYSSVSHMGFVVLGLFSMNATGMEGAVIQMVNHGLTTGALFACVGIFYERYHTREIAELGGLWKRLPLLAFFLILSALGSAAVPGLNGFVGEFPILTGFFDRSPRAAVLAATGMILGAYYLLWMVQCVVFGPLREPHGDVPYFGPDHAREHAHDHDSHAAAVRPVGWHEIAGLTPVMVLIVLIGVYPRPFFERFQPSVAEIAKGFADTGKPPLVATSGAGAGAGTMIPAATIPRVPGAQGVRISLPQAALPACCDPDSSLSLSRYRKAAATATAPVSKNR